MRICLVYDCLYPHTIGGAERWYRALAEWLVSDGHEVTYLTLRQWESDEDADFAGVRVLPVAPRMELYASGRRRIWPPLAFGAGVGRHLLRDGGSYDVVHTCSFPYFSLLAAALARRRHGFRLVVDWFEVWSRQYWSEYLGRAGGRAGWEVQRACAQVPQQALCFSQLHATRLRQIGLRRDPVVLAGLYERSNDDREGRKPRSADQPPMVAFAGRHIPEKRVPALVDAIAEARVRFPSLRGEILGDGPDRPKVLQKIAERGLRDSVEAPGVVAPERVAQTLRRASCMVLPSRREGYGLIVIEAAAAGTPSVVAAGPDNAATELVSDGENGVVVASADPADLAAGIERVVRAGSSLRQSTTDWFDANAGRLSLAASAATVTALYEGKLPELGAR